MIQRKLVMIFAVIVQMTAMVLIPALLYAAEAAKPQGATDLTGWGYVGAALAVGLACIGSGYAVSKIGSAGIGAVAEKPELMGKTLVFLGLAEGIAIYGLIIAVMILNKF